LNSASYIKIGQELWVDHIFSKAVVNGTYSFHASASAYMEFWNNSFGKTQQHTRSPLSRRQIWQAFVQESIRTVAAASSYSLELLDNLPISDVAEKAFDILGQNGMLHAAIPHSCSECTHPYKATVNINPPIPPVDGMDIDEGPPSADVKMVVLDGIVMGPTVSLNIIIIYI